MTLQRSSVMRSLIASARSSAFWSLPICLLSLTPSSSSLRGKIAVDENARDDQRPEEIALAAFVDAEVRLEHLGIVYLVVAKLRFADDFRLDGELDEFLRALALHQQLARGVGVDGEFLFLRAVERVGYLAKRESLFLENGAQLVRLGRTDFKSEAVGFGHDFLTLPAEQEIGDGFEGLGILAERLQRGPGLGSQPIRLLFRLLQSEQGRVGGFLGLEILARAFAEFFRGLGHVEDVVNDLEGEARGFGRIRLVYPNCFAVALADIAPRRIELAISAAVLFSWM